MLIIFAIFILCLKDGSLSIFGLFGIAIKIKTSFYSYSFEIHPFYSKINEFHFYYLINSYYCMIFVLNLK